MNANKKPESIFEDMKINVKMKLAGLWIAAMFSWVYGDLLRKYSGDYLADIGIDVDNAGLVTFSGVTDHPSLQGSSQAFTSKQGEHWTLWRHS